ncbi:MAG: hypothetical protein IPI04_12925 [Ignavibacteria bacterium]|nr:hypothetical protein [Ignavibacteria bacterium]
MQVKVPAAVNFEKVRSGYVDVTVTATVRITGAVGVTVQVAVAETASVMPCYAGYSTCAGFCCEVAELGFG